MASDINIKKPKGSRNVPLEAAGREKRGRQVERRSRSRSIIFSSLARAIFLSNMVGLLILIIGALTLNEVRRGLIDTKLQNLYSQAELISNVLAQNATGEDVIARLDEPKAIESMRLLALPDGTRARLYNLDAQLVSDSNVSSTYVSEENLTSPMTAIPAVNLTLEEQAEGWFKKAIRMIPNVKRRRDRLRRNLPQDVSRALLGDPVIGEQYNDQEQLIVAVSVAVRRVNSVVGVVTLESNDVEAILDGERRALAPIILWPLSPRF